MMEAEFYITHSMGLILVGAEEGVILQDRDKETEKAGIRMLPLNQGSQAVSLKSVVSVTLVKSTLGLDFPRHNSTLKAFLSSQDDSEHY